MKYKDLMIDVESLDVTENAVLLQLAGVYFNRNTGETGAEFCKSFDFEKCEADGFTISQSTVEWWLKQDEEIYKSVTSNQEDPLEVMKAFDDFYSGQANIWGHGNFDFAVVNKYMKFYLNKELPYRAPREIRTLVDVSGIRVDDYGKPDAAHSAPSDCHFQIKYVCGAIAKING